MDYLNENIKKSKFWAQFAAIMFLIWVALSFLGSILGLNSGAYNQVATGGVIFNLIITVITIVIPCIILLKFSSRCKNYLNTDDEESLEMACASQGLFVKYIGIMYLVFIILGVLGVIATIALASRY